MKSLAEYLEKKAKRGQLTPEHHAATLKLWEAIRSVIPNMPDPDCGVSDSGKVQISWSHRKNEPRSETNWTGENIELETLEFDIDRVSEQGKIKTCYEAFYLNKPKGITFNQAETWEEDMPDLTISPELKEKLKIFEIL